MPRLTTMQPRVSEVQQARVPVDTTAQRRMTGRALQARRLRIWASSPRCAGCGRLTRFPDGFELDHKVALFAGGADEDANCQVLCVSIDEAGRKAGCHADKTAAEQRDVR